MLQADRMQSLSESKVILMLMREQQHPFEGRSRYLLSVKGRAGGFWLEPLWYNIVIVICFLLQALYTQYLQFKEHEIPLKENEKTKIQTLYKMLEVRKSRIKVILMVAASHSVLTAGLRFCHISTDVDRVWAYSASPGSSPERHGEGMGQINCCHAGEGEEPAA